MEKCLISAVIYWCMGRADERSILLRDIYNVKGLLKIGNQHTKEVVEDEMEEASDEEAMIQRKVQSAVRKVFNNFWKLMNRARKDWLFLKNCGKVKKRVQVRDDSVFDAVSFIFQPEN